MTLALDAEGRRFVARKISALSKILQHLPKPDENEISDLGFAHAATAIHVIMSPRAGNLERAACSLILDAVIPSWRNMASVEALGAVSSRTSSAVRKWRRAVLDRDDWECRECGSKEDLEAHHIAFWSESPFLRVDEDNGVTLCKECHLRVHSGGAH